MLSIQQTKRHSAEERTNPPMPTQNPLILNPTNQKTNQQSSKIPSVPFQHHTPVDKIVMTHNKEARRPD